jgi:polyisoprenoid-binding protein YceI
MEVKLEQATVTFTDGNKVRGEFEKLNTEIRFDPEKLAESSFEASIPVSSISLSNLLQTTKAKGKDWFDHHEYPIIHFRSDKIYKISDGYMAQGILRIKNKANQIKIPFTYQKTSAGVYEFIGNFTISSEDYNFSRKSKYDEDIHVKVVVPVVQEKG